MDEALRANFACGALGSGGAWALGAEAATVFGGAEAVALPEDAGEVALIVEAGIKGDLADGVVALFQLTPGHVQTDAGEVFDGAHAEEFEELAL